MRKSREPNPPRMSAARTSRLSNTRGAVGRRLVGRSVFAALAATALILGGATASEAGPRLTSLSLPNVDPTNTQASRPEGVAIYRNQVYVSSVGSGTIFRAGVKDTQATVFLPGGADGRTSATGIKADNGRLFVSGAATGKVFVYNIASGALEFSGVAPGTGASFINDVAIANDGSAYFTDSRRASLYRLQKSGTTWRLEEAVSFVGTPFVYTDGFNANGIVISDSGDYALVVQSNTGKLFRVGLKNKSVIEVPVAFGGLPGGDGLLLLEDNELLAIGSGVLKSVILSDDWTTASVVKTTADPSFVSPTTGAVKGERLWVVNAQFNRGPNPILPFNVSIVEVPSTDS
jgi:sugar lactone lactonase YvrE